MSITTSTPQTICNSPLNLSKSKMLFSIPKAPRMGIEAKSPCAQPFYELPAVRETRATGFGYGKKSDFTRTTENSPSPNAYNIRSEIGSPHKRGFSFGLSREQMPISGNATVGEKRSPGPANYDTRETNKTSISFSFRPKTELLDQIQNKKMANPGPGTYSSVETLSPSGKIFAAKYQSASTTIFSPARSRRFVAPKDAKRPGPGAYNVGNDLNTTGSYFVSKFRSSLGKSFGLSLKQHTMEESFKESIPGPGAYKHPSEFGHYENKSATVQSATLQSVQHTVA